MELVLKAFLPGGVFPHGHQLTATLALPREPLGTNGVWKADEQRVEWKAALPPNDEPTNSRVQRSLPDILFALWVEPAAEKQIEHFGKVVLNDQELIQYCLWRCGLPEKRPGCGRLFRAAWSRSGSDRAYQRVPTLPTNPRMPKLQLPTNRFAKSS